MPLFVIFQPHLPAAVKDPAVFVPPVLSALPLDLSRPSLHQSNDHFTDRQTSVGPVLPVSSVPQAALCPDIFERIAFYRRPSTCLFYRRLSAWLATTSTPEIWQERQATVGSSFLFRPGGRQGVHFLPAPPQLHIQSNQGNDQQRNFRHQDRGVFFYRIINHHTDCPYDKRNGVDG